MSILQCVCMFMGIGQKNPEDLLLMLMVSLSYFFRDVTVHSICLVLQKELGPPALSHIEHEIGVTLCDTNFGLRVIYT